MFALRKGLIHISRNGMSMGQKLKHTLPELPYAFNALEPIISSEIMEVHYTKHHATYVNNLNALEEKLTEAVAKKDTSAVISIQSLLTFNAGGHFNHAIYWSTLTPASNFGKPSNELMQAICKNFESFDKMKEQLSSLAVQVQGSGWAWLAYNPVNQQLQLIPSANQDLLENKTGLIPLFGIDVWEHAYYLQYKNVRAEYVKNIWEIVNWQNVSERYAAASKAKRN